MAISEEIKVVDLTSADIEAGLALSDEAGWNQTGDDWRHFIECGRTMGVRDDDGRLVASAAALPYERHFGFVAMVLVTESWRRRGLATRLVDHCIDELRRQNRVPMLDATPAGEMVYRRQGFHSLFGLDRWQRPAELEPLPPVGDMPFRAADPDTVIRLDAEAMGSGRAKLMRGFLARSGTRAVMGGDGESFAMIRDGRHARQVGPIVARSQAGALELLAPLIAGCRSMVFIDVLSAWRDMADWLAECGFTIQRSFSRMAFGRAEPFGSPERLFAVSGPEFG